jgi:hypothetical protein
MAYYLRASELHMPAVFQQTMEIEMKTSIAALALLSLAAGPVFAAGAYGYQSGYAPQTGYYGTNGYRLRGPGEVNIPNPSGGIPGN